MTSRICKACGIAKPIEDFETVPDRHGNPLPHTTCRQCRNAQRRAAAAKWYRANAERHKASVSRRRAERRD